MQFLVGNYSDSFSFSEPYIVVNSYSESIAKYVYKKENPLVPNCKVMCAFNDNAFFDIHDEATITECKNAIKVAKNVNIE